MKPNCVCGYCKKEFYKKPVRINKDKNHFCSWLCYRKYTKNNGINCSWCSNITTNPKFCSSSCAAKFNNTGKPSHNRRKERQNCLECGQKCRTVKSKYCSSFCQRKYIRDEYIKKWLQNEVNGSTNNGLLNSKIRNYLIEKANNKCTQCGWGKINPYSNKVSLEVDHIDGDWRNNRPENLRILCLNCHSLTPTFKALNKTNHNRPIKVTRKKLEQ